MKPFSMILSLFLVMGASIMVRAQEHPTEHPTEHTAKKPVTIETVAKHIEAHVAQEAEEGDGWMMVEDEQKEATLKLKLDKVHRERLSKIEEGTYFVCADFATPEGKTYDLDFWVKETDKGLEVTETMIHKEAGAPRYTWVEKEGVWSRKPLTE